MADPARRPADAVRRRRRTEAGVTATEYLGVVVVVAALVGVLGLTPIGRQVSGGIQQAICSIMAVGGCGGSVDVAGGGSAGGGSSDDGSDGADGSDFAGAQGLGSVETSSTAEPECSGVWCSVKGAAGTVWSGTKDAAGGLWGGTKGVAGAAWDDVTGIWDVVTDPGSLVDAGKAIWDDPLGVAGQLFWDQESRDSWSEGDHANAVGRTLWNVGSIVIGVTKIGKAGKVGKVGQLGGLADEAAGLAADARRAADAATDAARAGDAAKAAEAAAQARRAADDAAERAARLGCPVSAPPLGRIGGGRGLAAMTAPAAPLVAVGCGDAGDAARQADEAADAAETAAAGAGALPTAAEAAGLVRSAKPVGSALKSDVWHRAPTFAVDDIAQHGTVFRLVGGDGVERLLVQAPGEVNGVTGRFEWIVDGGNLTHQMFVRNGTINGIPIRP